MENQGVDVSSPIVAEETERLLAFSLGKEEYAVFLSKVKQVIGLTDIMSIPYTPSYFLGIMNLRGQVISIIDLRKKFLLHLAEMTSETAIIILDLSPLTLGIVVDSVNSVVSFLPQEMSPPPDVEGAASSHCITGVVKKEKRLILISNKIRVK